MILDNQATSFSICFICSLDLVVWNRHMGLSCIFLKPASSPLRWNIEAGIEGKNGRPQLIGPSAKKRQDSGGAEPRRWSRSNSYKQVPSGPAAWTMSTSPSLHSSFIFLPFGVWKRGAKISSLTLLPALITSVLMSCSPCRTPKCSSLFFLDKLN